MWCHKRKLDIRRSQLLFWSKLTLNSDHKIKEFLKYLSAIQCWRDFLKNSDDILSAEKCNFLTAKENDCRIINEEFHCNSGRKIQLTSAILSSLVADAAALRIFFKVLVDNFRIFGVGKQFRLQNFRPVHVFIEILYQSDLPIGTFHG